MSSKYYCRIEGLDDDYFAEYETKDHIEAASEYARDVSFEIRQNNPAAYVKEMVVEVISGETDDQWRIKIEMIHIRRM